MSLRSCFFHFDEKFCSFAHENRQIAQIRAQGKVLCYNIVDIIQKISPSTEEIVYVE